VATVIGGVATPVGDPCLGLATDDCVDHCWWTGTLYELWNEAGREESDALPEFVHAMEVSEQQGLVRWLGYVTTEPTAIRPEHADSFLAVVCDLIVAHELLGPAEGVEDAAREKR